MESIQSADEILKIRRFDHSPVAREQFGKFAQVAAWLDRRENTARIFD